MISGLARNKSEVFGDGKGILEYKKERIEEQMMLSKFSLAMKQFKLRAKSGV